MLNTDRVSQLAACALLVLFILVPSTMLLTRKASLAWLAWTIVSLWAALDAVRLTILAFPERHTPGRALSVAMLAGANMALSLGLALLPAAWISALR